MSKALEPHFNILVGTNNADEITGGPGRDLVLGRGGDDVIDGGDGRDQLVGDAGDDRIFGGAGSDDLIGFDGDDQLSGGRGSDRLFGGVGSDMLFGNEGSDMLAGGAGQDTLTGGKGKDSFVFDVDPFFEGAPAPVVPTGLSGLNLPDVITDFKIGCDSFLFDADVFGVDELRFASGVTAELAGDANVIVQRDPFANAASAALALADNDAVTADEGFFIYFNTTLGIHRLVYSEDLSDGGDFSVLANLTNQTDVAALAAYAAGDFLLA